jgi:hypothetical protein
MAVLEGPNEPDYAWAQHQAGNGYPSTVDPATAASIQCQLFQAVRSVDQQRTVLSMAQSLPSYEKTFIANAHGCYTGFSFHAYPYLTGYGSNTYFGLGSGLADEFAGLRSARSSAGDTVAIWVTETGYSFMPGSNATANAAQESSYADASRRLYNRMITMSDVAVVLFHTVRDDPMASSSDPSSTEYHFGFFNKDWTPKPRACEFVSEHGGSWAGC